MSANRSSDIDLPTLAISAAASATAAYVCSKVWAAGTLASAAAMPVLVALLKEALRRPTDMVASAVPRPTLRGAAGRPRRSVATADELDGLYDRGAPPPLPPPAPGAEHGPVRVYSTRGRRMRWRLAVITGLLGFGVCVVLYTVPELIAGGSAGRSGSATTLFGGHRGHRRATSTTTTAPAATQTTPAQTVTVPGSTVTVPAPASTAPASPPAATNTTTTPAPATAPPAAAGPSTTPQP